MTDEKPGTMYHVSSICPAGDHKMACTWYVGSKDCAPDVAIYLSIFDETKSEWTRPQLLVDSDIASKELDSYVRKVGNSLIYRDGRGRLWLIYASIVVGGWGGSSLNYKISVDEGATWSKSEKLILSPIFNLAENVKNKGINLDDVSFIIPVYRELGRNYSMALHVDTSGREINYTITKISDSINAIQPVLLREDGDNIVALFRNSKRLKGSPILFARSSDLGKTWSNVQETNMANWNSGFDMIQMSDGAYLGIVNNGIRENLTIVTSRDGGRNWKPIKVLEKKKDCEYSYPSISRSSSGLYHVTYSYERKRIKHLVFNEQWLMQQEGRDH